LGLDRRGRDLGQNEVAEAGCEPFDLCFYALRHVDVRTVGDVTIGPERVLPGGRPGGVDDRWLRDQAEGAIGVATAGGIPLALRHLGERAADVERDGLTALLGQP